MLFKKLGIKLLGDGYIVNFASKKKFLKYIKIFLAKKVFSKNAVSFFYKNLLDTLQKLVRFDWTNSLFQQTNTTKSRKKIFFLIHNLVNKINTENALNLEHYFKVNKSLILRQEARKL